MGNKIVFFGSAPFSPLVLLKLIQSQIPILAVVTAPDKPVGRHLKLTPNPVKVLAQKHQIPVFETINDYLMTMNDDRMTGLVAAYGQIIPQSILDKFSGQIYGIHPSLLPKYRGPSPLQQQILDGVTETGVTVIQLDALVDHGPIVAQEKDTVLPDDTTQTLGQRLFAKGAEMFLQLLNNSPLPFPSLSQREGPEVSYTRKFTRQDGFVDYEKFTSALATRPDWLDRMWRAFHPWPGLWTVTAAGKRLKLVALRPVAVVCPEGGKPAPWQDLQLNQQRHIHF